MGAQRGKQPAGARHDDCEHMRGYATAHLGQGCRVRHRRLTHEAARTVTTQAENLSDQPRNSPPRPRHRGLLPTDLITRMAVALSSRGRMLEPASAMRLTARARQSRRAPYPGTGRNRRRGDVFRDAFKEWGKGSALQLGRKGSRAWERASRPMCDAIHENPSHLALLRRPQRDPSPAHIPRLCAA
jgi:hypothetical protein